VSAELASGLVPHRPVLRREPVPLEEGAIVTAREKARLLALGPAGRREPSRRRAGARLRLRTIAEREPEPLEVPRVEPGEHVRLILPGVDAAREEQAAAVLREASVVAGGEPGGADPPREGEELGEAEAAVAADARIRSLAACVAGDERPDDRAAELLAEVEREVRHTERVAGLARGDDGCGRAARALAVRAGRVGPEAKGDADRLRPRLTDAQESDRAVHAAAHGDGDALGAVRRRRRRDDGAEGVGERVGCERPARGGTRGDERKSAHGRAELGHARAVAVHADDPAAVEGQADPGEVVPAHCVSDGVHRAITVPHPYAGIGTPPPRNRHEAAVAVPSAQP